MCSMIKDVFSNCGRIIWLRWKEFLNLKLADGNKISLFKTGS